MPRSTPFVHDTPTVRGEPRSEIVDSEGYYDPFEDDLNLDDDLDNLGTYTKCFISISNSTAA
jgi:hypothetical protein